LARGLQKTWVLFEQKKTKLLNKWHFVGKNKDFAACPKNAVNFCVA
jgi:hypothetical protein